MMMYVRFPLNLHNVKDLLAQRGIDICHVTVRHWWYRFGPCLPPMSGATVSRINGFHQCKWHFDEVYSKINGEMHYLWREVDQESENLASDVTKTGDKKAAMLFIKETLGRHGSPEHTTTDGLRSYEAAMKELGYT